MFSGEAGSGPSMEAVVRRLSSLAGVSMVMILGPGGEELYRWYKTSADKLRIGVGPEDVLGIMDRVSSFLSKASSGPLEDVIIRAGNRVAVIRSAGDSLLITVAEKTANLALLLIRSRSAAEELSKLTG